ncbi:hypothetical protein GWC77_26635 [Paraburkholderia sp. NMBU_R16]|uniref:hypothetical protein n=1 Tax=Paraburkholderia sp. NMBU_R16 TaxID=2698676 RepID=UPI001566A19E|nr:hypothetical protein [Paraburkholderia sp. NMBU_R16]NRO99461.1 hypothetical protein [Paraburkholderia sp. NMBU_R16]
MSQVTEAVGKFATEQLEYVRLTHHRYDSVVGHAKKIGPLLSEIRKAIRNTRNRALSPLILRLGNDAARMDRKAESVHGSPLNEFGTARHTLKGFNADLTKVDVACRNMVEVTDNLARVHEMLAQMISIEIGSGQIAICLGRSTEDDLDGALEKLKQCDSDASRAFDAFEALVGCCEKDLEELGAAPAGDGRVVLGQLWSGAIKMSLPAYCHDVLTARIILNYTYEKLIQKEIARLAQGREIVDASMTDIPGEGDRQKKLAVGSGMWDERAEVIINLRDLCENCRGFALRVDRCLTSIEQLRGSPGLSNEYLFQQKASLIGSSERINLLALEQVEQTRPYAMVLNRSAKGVDAATFDAFVEVAWDMSSRIDALLKNIVQGMSEFPANGLDDFVRAGDVKRGRVSELLAQQCDEIGADIAWLSRSVAEENVGLVEPDLAAFALDELESVIARIGVDLQRNSVIADATKKSRGQKWPTSLDQEVKADANSPLVEDYGVSAMERSVSDDNAVTRAITLPKANRPGTKMVSRRRRVTKQQVRPRVSRAPEANGDQSALKAARDTLGHPSARNFDIGPCLAYAEERALTLRQKCDESGFYLLSGGDVLRVFGHICDTLQAMKMKGETRIKKIDEAVEIIAECVSGAALSDMKRGADETKLVLEKKIVELSARIDALQKEARNQQMLQNLKLFAQRPTRELFVWLTENDPDSLVSVEKSVDRQKLSGRTPDGRLRAHDDYFDEYLISLRDKQNITYVSSNELTGKSRLHAPTVQTTTVVDKVALHVHYPAKDAKRPSACHFKIEPQRYLSGRGAYRSGDSAALMAGVLKAVDDMSRGAHSSVRPARRSR